MTFNKTGKPLSYKGKSFQSLKGAGRYANYRDVETGEEYWISGPKRDGTDRHWAGSGKVEIDEDVREEYLTQVRKKSDK